MEIKIKGNTYKVKESLSLRENIEIEKMIQENNPQNIAGILAILLEPIQIKDTNVDILEIKENDFYAALSYYVENKKKLISSFNKSIKV